jgi:hypothetical protein
MDDIDNLIALYRDGFATLDVTLLTSVWDDGEILYGPAELADPITDKSALEDYFAISPSCSAPWRRCVCSTSAVNGSRLRLPSCSSGSDSGHISSPVPRTRSKVGPPSCSATGKAAGVVGTTTNRWHLNRVLLSKSVTADEAPSSWKIDSRSWQHATGRGPR